MSRKTYLQIAWGDYGTNTVEIFSLNPEIDIEIHIDHSVIH